MMDCYAFKFNREKYNHCKNALVKRIKRNGPRIAGITTLDLLFSSYLLPSLRELDFTNNMGVSIDIVGTFFRECSRLEKVTYRSMNFYLDGRVMKSANNLLKNSTLMIRSFVTMRAGSALFRIWIQRMK